VLYTTFRIAGCYPQPSTSRCTGFYIRKSQDTEVINCVGQCRINTFIGEAMSLKYFYYKFERFFFKEVSKLRGVQVFYFQGKILVECDLRS
jgi:hypothetical protein